MSRYDAMFARLAEREEGAFCPFLMLGDPDTATSGRLLRAAAEGGADMIEVGIPFSDPVADGPIIQAAAERALDAGVRVEDALTLIAELRQGFPDLPIGILTYANIAMARGAARFAADAAAAGADSLLIADIPSIEAAPFASLSRAAGLDPVLIAATNSKPAQLDRIAKLGSGYTYCLARAGVTGVQGDIDLDHGTLFAELGARNAPPPVLGFGISEPDHVRAALAAGASGAISGSAVVRLIAQPEPEAAIRSFVQAMKAATCRG